MSFTVASLRERIVDWLMDMSGFIVGDDDLPEFTAEMHQQPGPPTHYTCCTYLPRSSTGYSRYITTQTVDSLEAY